MRCPRCNSEIREGAAFCTVCGMKVQEMTRQEMPSEKEELLAMVRTFVDKQEAKQRELQEKLQEASAEIAEKNRRIQELQEQLAQAKAAQAKAVQAPAQAIPVAPAEAVVQEKRCAKCGNVLREGMRFCNQCGTPVGQQ